MEISYKLAQEGSRRVVTIKFAYTGDQEGSGDKISTSLVQDGEHRVVTLEVAYLIAQEGAHSGCSRPL